MQNSIINKTFDKLVKSCPHGEANLQCPFEVYRSFKRDGFSDITDICSLHNKELMLKYHAVCNKIRTKAMEKEVRKAV